MDIAVLGLPFVPHDLLLEPLGTRNLLHIDHKDPSSERHLVPHTRLVYPGVLSLISCVNPQNLLFSLVLLLPPLALTIDLSAPLRASCLRRSAPCSRTCWMFARRISAPEPLCLIFGSVARVSVLWPQWLL